VDPEEARDRVRRSTWVGWRSQGGWEPRLLERGDGSTLFDAEGTPYLDFGAALVATNLGYGNAAVASAIASQAVRLPYVAPGFASRPRAELAEALDAVLPEGLRRYFFSTSGTEANEAAVKIARLVTGRSKIVSRTRSYHGATSASLALSGDLRRDAVAELPMVPGTLSAPDCYCYRCPLGLTYPDCGVACADEVDAVLARSGDVAAVLVEPVVGTNGVLVPAPEYLPKLRAITQRHGALLIADEVMTGWGRTGHWFAVDAFGVRPDLLTTAKGLTGAYVPLGLTATTPELHDAFRDRFFPHGHTYEAHPVGLAAAVAAIGEYRRLGLIEKSRRDGGYLLDRLRELEPRHRSIGEVRGMGLFAAVELVRDRASKAPMNRPEEKLAGRSLVVDEVAAAMARDGVLVLPWVSHLVLAPPLIVTRPEIDRAVQALDRALAIADARAA
jgi:taurine---2-oxoglutarate transaminase